MSTAPHDWSLQDWGLTITDLVCPSCGTTIQTLTDIVEVLAPEEFKVQLQKAVQQGAIGFGLGTVLSILFPAAAPFLIGGGTSLGAFKGYEEGKDVAPVRITCSDLSCEHEGFAELREGVTLHRSGDSF